jgi:DNA-binding transcriptional LysR family regulator
MDRLDAMRLYTRVVDRNSFTHAAQDLEVPRSTATQVIKELESRLGVRLLERTTRSVRPTLDGQAYYERCVAILGEIEDAESAFRSAKPRGLLRIDVHGTLARHFVLPALPAFLAEYPDLQLQISEGDRLVDLVREGIDCVLRVGDLQDGAMIARRVAMLSEVTCASPAYLARYGVPSTVADLHGHVAVAFMSSATGAALPLEFTVEGVLSNRVLPATVTVAAAESYVAAARLGLGLIQVPHYHVAADLKAGSLVEILAHNRPSSTPVSLLYPHRRQLSLRVRVFIDWLAREFAKHPEVSIATP